MQTWLFIRRLVEQARGAIDRLGKTIYPRNSYLAFLQSRRSVRRFHNRTIPDALLDTVIEAATWAPSAHNRQPWRFVILKSVEARSCLAEEMGVDFLRDLKGDGLSLEDARRQVERSRQRIEAAPAAILICLDISAGDRYPDERRQTAELWMGIQGAAMAGQNLLLAAHALGLAGVWMCAPLFAQETVQHALEIPPEWKPQGLVALGFARQLPPQRKRRSAAEVSVVR